MTTFGLVVCWEVCAAAGTDCRCLLVAQGMAGMPSDPSRGGSGRVQALPRAKHPSVCPRTTVLQSMKLGVDVNRHKEIIVKAISAVLLLLLKHFKLNHIYQVSWAGAWPSFGGGQHPGWGSAFTHPCGLSPQFEYMAQHLVFANCIPLILKFFNQNIMSYITAKNR